MDLVWSSFRQQKVLKPPRERRPIVEKFKELLRIKKSPRLVGLLSLFIGFINHDLRDISKDTIKDLVEIILEREEIMKKLVGDDENKLSKMEQIVGNYLEFMTVFLDKPDKIIR